ncbi:MAG: GTPase domain-containing protein [Acidobacteria bacterium]|nr:GTPase domain-containing protein [Acidobacteriota bacterium]
MVLFNYATKEITAKIVYYGPGLCGKTTNLQFIYDSLPSNNKSKMLSLATKTDRTLFFDFLPLDLGKIRGMRTKLQLYTVPGQVYYNSTRQLVLKGADGVVFVADSQDFALDANQESLQNLEDNLKRQGIRIADLPVVMQYNKRDLPNAMAVAELESSLNAKLKAPSYESVATTGLGVEETLRGIAHHVLTHLIKKYGLEGGEPLEKDQIQVLNMAPPEPAKPAKVAASSDSVWADDDQPAATTPAAPVAAPVKAAVAASGQVFVEDDDDDDLSAPMVGAELVSQATPPPPGGFVPEKNPFGDLPSFLPDSAEEVPIASVEMQLPEGILNSLPKIATSPGVATPVPAPTPPVEAERRTSDGLVKEVTLPLNLSLSELKGHKKLRLRITLDVNILP